MTVGPDLTLPGHPEVFALGDMVRVQGADGTPVTLPGVAPVAMQQGRYAAEVTRARLRGKQTPPFRYRDKGNLATIGRGAGRRHQRAEAQWIRRLGDLAPRPSLVYLVGFQNRLIVMIRWTWSFVTHGRGARVIAGPPLTGDRPPPE